MANASQAQVATTGATPGAMSLGQPNAAAFPRVTVYAYPTDSRGLLLPGLPATAFRTTENGREFRLIRVCAGGGTLDVALALDASPSMLDESKLPAARMAARQFLEQLADGDRAAVVRFGGRTELLQPLTAERGPAVGAVDRVVPFDNMTAFLDGVYWSVRHLAPTGGASMVGSGRVNARRVAVVLTDGIDNASHVAPAEVIRLARDAGVSICTIALGSDADSTLLGELARETGGFALKAPAAADLQRLYVELARQLRQAYQLEYETPNPSADGTRRDVRVEVRLNAQQGGLTGTAWYMAPAGGGSMLSTPSGGTSGAPGLVQSPAGAPKGPDRTAVGLAILLGLVAVGFALWLLRRPRSAPPPPAVLAQPVWMTGPQMVVGRDAQCELVLEGNQVSRVHARIEWVRGEFWLEDQGSRNGTWVNGRRVSKRTRIQAGDLVRFGNRECRFAGIAPGALS